MNGLVDTLQTILDQVKDGLRLVPAPDDSMAGHFRRNDLLIVDPNDLDIEDGIALIDIGSGPTPVSVTTPAPGLYRLTKRCMLWTPIEAPKHRMDELVVGRVIGAVVRFKRARR